MGKCSIWCKMLTSSLEELRPQPSRKTTVRQQQRPLFTSNTEPSQLCRHGSPASDSAPHAVIGLTDFLFPAQKANGEVLDPPGCKLNLLLLGASRFLGYTFYCIQLKMLYL